MSRRDRAGEPDTAPAHATRHAESTGTRLRSSPVPARASRRRASLTRRSRACRPWDPAIALEHIIVCFSALTFPNPASPRAVVNPTHVQTRHGQCRPSPPVLTSRRVSRPPVFARVCPRPSPAGACSLPPTTLETIFLPLFPVTRFSRSNRDPTRVCGYTFFFPEFVARAARSGPEAREGAHAEAPSPPSPSSSPPRPRSIERAEPRIRSGLERRRGSNATRPVADCSISTANR